VTTRHAHGVQPGIARAGLASDHQLQRVVLAVDLACGELELRERARPRWRLVEELAPEVIERAQLASRGRQDAGDAECRRAIARVHYAPQRERLRDLARRLPGDDQAVTRRNIGRGIEARARLRLRRGPAHVRSQPEGQRDPRDAR
jgi:hypothetical protein